MTLQAIIADMCASLDGIAGTLRASAEMTRATAVFVREEADRMEAQQQPRGGADD